MVCLLYKGINCWKNTRITNYNTWNKIAGDGSNDQKRIMTPIDAFKNKVTGIVIGRSLTNGNVKNNTKRLVDHLNQWSGVVKFVGYQILKH